SALGVTYKTQFPGAVIKKPVPTNPAIRYFVFSIGFVGQNSQFGGTSKRRDNPMNMGCVSVEVRNFFAAFGRSPVRIRGGADCDRKREGEGERDRARCHRWVPSVCVKLGVAKHVISLGGRGEAPAVASNSH